MLYIISIDSMYTAPHRATGFRRCERPAAAPVMPGGIRWRPSPPVSTGGATRIPLGVHTGAQGNRYQPDIVITLASIPIERYCMSSNLIVGVA